MNNSDKDGIKLNCTYTVTFVDSEYEK